MIDPLTPPCNENTVWTTLTLGLHASVEAYRNALDECSVIIGDGVDELFSRMDVRKSPCPIPLYLLSVSALCPRARGVGFDEIIEKTKRLGYGLCPAEVGPALRLARGYQSEFRWVVAMQPVRLNSGSERVFDVSLYRDERHILRTAYAFSNAILDSSDHVVFTDAEHGE